MARYKAEINLNFVFTSCNLRNIFVEKVTSMTSGTCRIF